LSDTPERTGQSERNGQQENGEKAFRSIFLISSDVLRDVRNVPKMSFGDACATLGQACCGDVSRVEPGGKL